MKNILKFTSFALAIAFAFSQYSHAALWSGGHGDIGIGYEISSNGYDLEPHWHLGEDNEAVTLNGVTAPLGEEGAEYEANSNDIIATTRFVDDVLGSSYFVFPKEEHPAAAYLGFGTEGISSTEWSGNLTLSLTGASGPGDFYLFTEDVFGNPIASISAVDGTTTGSITLFPEDHAHHILAFTDEGRYNLTFEVSGEHISDGSKTGSATFGFFAIPEPSTAGLLLGVAALALTVARRRV